MKKIVRENLNEGRITFDEKVDEIFMDEISRLRSKVFPKLSNDELQYFMKKLKDWSLDMLGEKPQESKEYNPIRGDMDDISWGDPGSTDTKPGWGEMGG